MRKKKIQKISEKVAFIKTDIDSLLLLRKYAEKGQYNLLSEYKIEAKDVDVLNHLSPLVKLKPKEIQEIKKNII